MVGSNPFASMFGRSPFKPLQEHMKTVLKSAIEVTLLFEALCENDQSKVESVREKISKFEGEADTIKNEMRAHLPKSLLMPVDRRDLLEILDLQDSIADTAKHIADLLIERRMDVLDDMRQPLLEMVRRCVDACDQTAHIIGRLDELVETGFRGRESDGVITMVEQLAKIETDTDRMGLDLIRILFANEDNMKPVSVVFWYDLIRMIGELADYSEKVGNRVRLLLAR
jgi:uncharacterized protein